MISSVASQTATRTTYEKAHSSGIAPSLLVIDDEEVICQIVEGFLSHEGWQVDAARSIEAAHELTAKRTYAVVICDVHLSGDSVAFVRSLKKSAPATQVIMFTGDPSVHSVREAMAAGAYDYLAKPAKRDEMVHAVSRAHETFRLHEEREVLWTENQKYREQLELSVQQKSEQLRETELRYRSLFDQAVDAIFVIAAGDGRILDVNSAGQHLLGLDSEAIIGRSITEFLGGQLERPLKNLANRTASEERIERVIFAGAKERRRTAQVSLGGVILGGVPCVQVVARDLTDHIELIERNELMELELLSEQRLANIGLLASGVAHNINTPLMGIYGAAQLIKMKHPDVEDVDGVITQVERITAIIRNLMWTSRQAQESAMQEIDLNQLLTEELKFLEADLEFKHGVDKVYDFADRIPSIFGRYSDFSQSFLNIIRNALDSMHGRAEQKLTVQTSIEGDHIAVSITDTGCGIATEDRDKIFMPFFSTKPVVGSNNSEGPTGTGLGLSTVQKLLNPYGVRFQIESEPNKGTAFRVLIPIAMNSPARAAQAQRD